MTTIRDPKGARRPRVRFSLDRDVIGRCSVQADLVTDCGNVTNPDGLI